MWFIVVSPHATAYADTFHISPGLSATGDMARFGAPEVKLTVAYDHALAGAIAEEAAREGVPAGTKGERDRALDHGAFVPLQMLRSSWADARIVRIGLSGLSPAGPLRAGPGGRAGGGQAGPTGGASRQRRPVPQTDLGRPLRLRAGRSGIRRAHHPRDGKRGFSGSPRYTAGTERGGGRLRHRELSDHGGRAGRRRGKREALVPRRAVRRWLRGGRV